MTPLNIHCLQHVAFEGPATIADWMAARGHQLTTTHLYRGEVPPPVESVDWVVVMGGPMNIYEYRVHPWLHAEKQFLATAIAANKTILGVCLGSQLVADVLGAKVYQNMEKEIGWLPLHLNSGGGAEHFFPDAPVEMMVFHWHGDTFDLPPNAVRLASSVACANQAFAVEERIVGLQFHLEGTPASIAAMVAHGSDDLTGGRFIQSAAEITGNHAHFEANHQVLGKLLELLEARTVKSSSPY